MDKKESRVQTTEYQINRSFKIDDPNKISVIKRGNKIFWSKRNIAEKNLNIISCSNNEIWSSNRKSKKKKI